MATKSGENLQQMVSLGAYIRVFYDEASQVNFSAESAKFYWETVDKKMNSILNSDANNAVGLWIKNSKNTSASLRKPPCQYFWGK